MDRTAFSTPRFRRSRGDPDAAWKTVWLHDQYSKDGTWNVDPGSSAQRGR